jgi:NAD(P)-dependent dehydrogenase (short-subunit alcohol dehydrogenase family)
MTMEGKVVAVTGATSGIGACMAERFAAAGATVVIAGRRRAEGEALAARLGPRARFQRTDVGEERQVAALVADTVAAFGRLDCLVNNAGTAGALTGIADVTVEHLDAILRVHVRGVLLGMKHAAPVMMRQRSGSIVNTASLAGSMTGFSEYAYAAAKAAVIHLTRCAAVELGEYGVRVNSVSPGPTVTGIFGKAVGLSDDQADREIDGLAERFAKLQPIPRAGLPADIAAAALFLASDAASFVNGVDLVVAGGSVGGLQWTPLMQWWKSGGAEA